MRDPEMTLRSLAVAALILSALTVGWWGSQTSGSAAALMGVPDAVAAAAHRSQAGQVEVTLTVLYDNLPASADLNAGWGFSVLVETPGSVVLFDAGGDGAALLANMRLLGKAPGDIGSVVISHAHADHVGGLQALLDLGLRPEVFLPEGFRASVRDDIRGGRGIALAEEGREIVPGVRSTGRVGRGIAEQGLIVNTDDGFLLLTGCSHPGLVAMVDQAMQVTGGEIAAVLGGFHLADLSREQVEELVEGLRSRGVSRVGPTHCTGSLAEDVFREAYGDLFVPMGAGRVLRFSRPSSIP